ncbi:MAG: hypothetical protein LC797_12310 [Chloroflexi bacterium]|nr:hypothetical protein [Chloroflexota bacterium]
MSLARCAREPVLIGLVVVAVTLYALIFARLNPDRIVPGTDSPQYDLMARQLVADRGFTLADQPPFVPTVFREPGYPLLVAAVYRLSDASVDVVVVLQAVLLGLAGYWVGRCLA